MEERKFKPTFATQANYQELARRLKEEINPLLSSLTSQFSSLSSVSELNTLTETLLRQQLGITNHQKFTGQKTGNQSLNAQ
ncbi:13099_t:CDS:2 [Ambispora leptoticha]|uniref:13099_t:CDS:1 n=1 Tax=Ambispora leptoticha TaxID=144679 RepID=A0A9N9BKC9_9GLOM|nr:13099_t:CDS:2 [Ambispora leptoticha]